MSAAVTSPPSDGEPGPSALPPGSPLLSKLVVILLLAASVGVAGFVVYKLGQLPRSVVPITWGRDACAECRGLIREPHFAAQLQLTNRQVVNFDDPGCLLRYLQDTKTRRLRTHAMYFHHQQEERWLRMPDIAFVPTAASPQDYRLGAVAGDTMGALSLEAAKAQVKALPSRRPAGLPARP